MKDNDFDFSPFAFGAIMIGILLAIIFANFLPWQEIGEALAGMWR